MFHLKKISPTTYEVVSDSDHKESTKVELGGWVMAARARNPLLHRRVMAMFQMGLHNQDVYKEHEFDLYRKDVTKVLGFYHFNKEGEIKADSLAYLEMETETFERLHNALQEFYLEKMNLTLDGLNREIPNYE